ncbi:MAG: alpha/beta hydrolase [Chloroflexi bacterium]|nr:MAG: alpha/beta hydrolase [Chloroflexota bacterium]
MAATLTPGVDAMLAVRNQQLHIRQWPGALRTVVLVHGLASNCMTWEATACALSAAGHAVVSVDQRGHGRSSKPEGGYGFDDVTGDLHALIQQLGLDRPIVAGQSWGGNVVLDFAARHPAAVSGIVLVDGGFIDLQAKPGATWESISLQLTPPALAGIPRAAMQARMQLGHANWSAAGVQHQLANFETLADGTIRPWLTLERHMLILRALWEQRVGKIYPQVTAPVLLLAAEEVSRERLVQKRAEVAAASALLRSCQVHWFADTDHDIHVQRPHETAALILQALASGFFAA